ncbi:MAG: LysR family transcriptional regulator [Burkholderiales bacterium]|nr:LysR family transcriptional regulator [Burkholderiales bacterium]
MNIRELDFGLLQCFTTLMKERSVSKSALRLELSQPAVSHSLARLRRLFDDPLLIKIRGGMTPTARALELETEVLDLLAGAEHLLRKSADFSPETSRVRFTIMSPEFVEYLLAPGLLEHVEAHAAGIDIAFRTSDPEHAPDWFESGEIDIRLGWLPDPPPLLRVKLLFRDPLVCIARRNHPRLKSRITAEQYVGAAHIRVEQPRTRVSTGAVDTAVAAIGGRLRIALQVQNAFALANAVAQSSLISTVPERLARVLAAHYPLQILPLPLDVPDVRIAMYWHERTHKQPAHRWFRQLLAETARTL